MATSSSGESSSTTVVYRVFAGLFSLLVLVQAVLAGQFLNVDGALISVHRALGAQVLPTISVVLLVVAVLVHRKTPAMTLVVLAAALVFLTTLQTGLGFLGRKSPGAASLHIPVGVTIFGLAIYNVTIARRLGKASAE